MDKLKIGPYVVVALLGQGGMGAVYRAKHEELGREVALKVLTTGAKDDELRSARFRREAEAALKLTHPGLVRVYDYGIDEGRQYMAMELVNGATLREVLDLHGTLPVPESVAIACQLLEALGACHAAGLLHRDVKPANVMIEASGKARLLDLGLVKQVDRTILTAEGSVVGTPRYMPPEMLSTGEVDLRGDIYQVGTILYECLAGRPVADKIGLMDVVEQVLNGPPPAMPAVLENGPRGVREFLARALARDPAERFDSCALAVATLRGGQNSGRIKTMQRSGSIAVSGKVVTEGALTSSGRVATRTPGEPAPAAPEPLPPLALSTRTPIGGLAARPPLSRPMRVPGAATPTAGMPPVGPARRLPQGVRLLVFALTGTLAAAGLVTWVALSRRAGLVDAPAPTPQRDRATPAALVVVTGPAEIRVEWRTERPVRGTVTLPAIGRTEREEVPRVAHKVVVDRLVPETHYELAVGDDEGAPPLVHTVITRSVAGVVREFTRVLEAADANKLMGELRGDMFNPFKRSGKGADSWHARLRSRFGGDEYQQAAQDFHSIRHLVAEADVPVLTRSRLLQRLNELEDLHEILEMGLHIDSGLKPRELFPAGLAYEEKLPEGLKPLVAVRFGPKNPEVALPPAPKVIEAGEPMVFNSEVYNLLSSDSRRRTRKTFEIAGPLTSVPRLERAYLGFRAADGVPAEKVIVWAVRKESRIFLGRISGSRGAPPAERFLRVDERAVADPSQSLELTFSNRDAVIAGVGVRMFSLVIYGEHP